MVDTYDIIMPLSKRISLIKTDPKYKSAQCHIGYCTWSSIATDLVTHVMEHHPEQLVELWKQHNNEFPAGFSDPVKLVILYDKDFFFNELYWVKFHDDGLNRVVAVQHVGRSGKIVDCVPSALLKPLKYCLNYQNDKKITAHGRVLNCSGDVREFKNMDDAFMREHGMDISVFPGKKFTIQILNTDHDVLPDEVSASFECCVCYDYMQPSIRLCKMGHSICANCATRMTTCPQCKQELTSQKNIKMEGTMHKLKWRCRYHEAGCLFTGFMYQNMTHFPKCLYRSMKCVAYLDCNWSGPYHLLKNHIQNTHDCKGNFSGCEIKFIVPEDRSTHFVHLISDYNQYFIFNLKLDDGGNVIFSMDHITHEDFSRFEYDLIIINPATRYFIKKSVFCNAIFDTRDVKEFCGTKNNVCRIPIQKFNDTLVHNNHFHYTVNVYENKLFPF